MQGNPALHDKAFDVPSRVSEGTMTQAGTYQKTAILLAICIGGASFTFNPGGMIFIWPGIILGLILALVTGFKKEYAMYTGPLYALCEGAVLGAISYAYNAQYAGIVLNAVMLTMAVFALMLFLYSSKIIQVTDRLRMGIGIATGAVFLVYMVSIVMSFFGSSIPMIHSAGPVGIGFSLLVVGIAAFNLLTSFDFIERASRRNVPKYMEWYGAFGLIVTLVWLYLEILRLLSKLNRR